MQWFVCGACSFQLVSVGLRAVLFRSVFRGFQEIFRSNIRLNCLVASLRGGIEAFEGLHGSAVSPGRISQFADVMIFRRDWRRGIARGDPLSGTGVSDELRRDVPSIVSARLVLSLTIRTVVLPEVSFVLVRTLDLLLHDFSLRCVLRSIPAMGIVGGATVRCRGFCVVAHVVDGFVGVGWGGGGCWGVGCGGGGVAFGGDWVVGGPGAVVADVGGGVGFVGGAYGVGGGVDGGAEFVGYVAGQGGVVGGVAGDEADGGAGFVVGVAADGVDDLVGGEVVEGGAVLVGVEDDVEVAFVAEVVLDSAGGGVVAEGCAGGGVGDRWGGVRGRGVVRCDCVRGGLRGARGVGERCCLVVGRVGRRGLRGAGGGWGSL
ncbi:hypothetical protein APR08_003467 [Nocardia amikacinitolerans]|nr:hypothetical protein [Nocardia amikacinitolerans]